MMGPVKVQDGNVVNMILYVDEDDVEVVHEEEHVLQLHHHEGRDEEEGNFLGVTLAAASAE